MGTDRYDAFRDLHHRDRPLLLPNAWDHAVGAALVDAGFPAVGTTSLGVAAAAGKSDATGGTLEETMTLAWNLARLPVPVTVDIEGGFSDRPAEVGRLVAELASYGVAGVNIEDGRADGTLAPVEHQVAVIEAVKAAAPRVFLNARTDTFWLAHPSDLAETLRRVSAYAAAGADGVFVPGIAGDADIRAVVEEVPVPLNVLHLPGRTDTARLTDLGVRRISCGSLLYRAALRAAVATALEVAGHPGDVPVPAYGDVQRLVGGR
ncbi:isocitrate lyase/phosphoenolpyruvate mutase family protein [Actinomadura miaoliensis]|uniref:Isocitrate lyase/phosphoenolpyruvate mutase family protein n=1 Tax=Actinomadura miaoliensis TaxID=430685 RepID=A0ABP7VHI9_9ACTN